MGLKDMGRLSGTLAAAALVLTACSAGGGPPAPRRRRAPVGPLATLPRSACRVPEQRHVPEPRPGRHEGQSRRARRHGHDHRREGRHGRPAEPGPENFVTQGLRDSSWSPWTPPARRSPWLTPPRPPTSRSSSSTATRPSRASRTSAPTPCTRARSRWRSWPSSPARGPWRSARLRDVEWGKKPLFSAVCEAICVTAGFSLVEYFSICWRVFISI